MVTKYQFFKILILGPGGRRRFDADHSVSEYLKFEDLIRQMLEWDPLKRIKPDQILMHEFFKTKIVDMGEVQGGFSNNLQTGSEAQETEIRQNEAGRKWVTSVTRSSAACPARVQRAQNWNNSNNLDSIAAIWS